MPKRKHDYPAVIADLMGTLQRALLDNQRDEHQEWDEPYYDWLPKRFHVTRQRFLGDSWLLNGFKVYAPTDDPSDDVIWRAVWGPFYPENFLIELVTGTETRDVWNWKKLRKVPTAFYTFETVRRYDQYDGWDAIEDVLREALDSYHEWKAGKLAVAS